MSLVTMQKSVTSRDKLQKHGFLCIINFHTCRAETLCRQDANLFQLESGLPALQGKLQIIFYLPKKQRQQQHTLGPCMPWRRYLFCRFRDHNLRSNASFNSVPHGLSCMFTLLEARRPSFLVILSNGKKEQRENL